MLWLARIESRVVAQLAGPCIVAVGSESVVLTLGSVVLCVLCGISRGSGFVEL